jgi:hypothetical protein
VNTIAQINQRQGNKFGRAKLREILQKKQARYARWERKKKHGMSLEEFRQRAKRDIHDELVKDVIGGMIV